MLNRIFSVLVSLHQKHYVVKQLLNMNEFLELYDVPDGLAYAIGMCLKLPSREKVVMATLDLIGKAMERKRQKNTKEEPR